ncbi:MAG: 2-amino-4-hydroxy-6-hydroxymethyldihydropteridine diphosphokinase [Elainellaceae cyanobacterium]
MGSNLGDSQAILRSAVMALEKHGAIGVTRRSSIYQTAAVGPPQPDYLNMCVVVETTLSAPALLQSLLAIEQQFGRERRERWGPRTLDLDLLLFDDVVLELPHLAVPHPRMAERAFVLVPLAEIAPDWVEPVSGKVIRALLRELAISPDSCSATCKADHRLP